jgi:hypothetical protein
MQENKEETTLQLENDYNGNCISWEADSLSAAQENLHLLWDSKVHYSAHKGPILN